MNGCWTAGVSVGTTGNGLVTGGRGGVGAGAGGGAVAVPDPPPPAENEIDPPALYPPFGGGPSVTGLASVGAAAFSEIRRRRLSTSPTTSTTASTATTAMTIQIQIGTDQS